MRGNKLKSFGEELARKALRHCASYKGEELENWILADAELSERIEMLDRSAGADIRKFLRTLGQKAGKDDRRTRELADSLIRAYEFRNFHDVVEDISETEEDPEKLEELLSRLHDWKVLESRAILEIVKGRISIIEKLRKMILGNAPETPSKLSPDNLHDLLADFPWLFNPEWQVFAEEKSISKQLRDWGFEDCKDDMANKRIDFLAFHRDQQQVVIIELKRPGHPVEADELQRLERYQIQLSRANENTIAVLVHGGEINIPANILSRYNNSEYFQFLKWSEMFEKAFRFYGHYRSILEGDTSDPNFLAKRSEVVRTRSILESGSAHRGRNLRKEGLGDTNP